MGKKIVKTFLEKGHEVIKATHKKMSDSFELEIRNRNQVLELLKKVKPDLVVHTAANIDNDFCELNKKDGFEINVVGTKNVCDGCLEIGAKMVFISTEYVFDGEKNAPYSEDDNYTPVNYYGELKVKAETHIKDKLDSYLILRPGILYGFNDLEPSNNFILFALEKLKKGEKIAGFSEQFTCSVLIDDVAKAIIKLVEDKKIGTYHLGGAEFINRYEFLLKLAKIYGFNENLVEKSSWKESKRIAKKPKKGIHLSIIKAQRGGIELHNVDEGLKIMKSQFPKEWFKN